MAITAVLVVAKPFRLPVRRYPNPGPNAALSSLGAEEVPPNSVVFSNAGEKANLRVGIANLRVRQNVREPTQQHQHEQLDRLHRTGL